MGVFAGVRREGSPDPTAGVTLMPHLALCPRCGIAKGRVGRVRRGLCDDCSRSMSPAHRALWNS